MTLSLRTVTSFLASFRGRLFPYLITTTAIFLLDQLSKAWAARSLEGSVAVGQWLTFTKTYNAGIGFGLLQGSGVWAGWLTLGIIAGLAYWLYTADEQQRFLRIGLAMLTGGALGNMVDRLAQGQVLDFIQTPLWPRVFNVADIAIRLGVVVVLLSSLGWEWKQRKG